MGFFLPSTARIQVDGVEGSQGGETGWQAFIVQEFMIACTFKG